MLASGQPWFHSLSWSFWWNANPIGYPHLGPVVQELFDAGLVGSMQRAYRTGERSYVSFCLVKGLPFPVNEPGLAAFVASLYCAGLAAGRVKSYLGVVRNAQIAVRLGEPTKVLCLSSNMQCLSSNMQWNAWRRWQETEANLARDQHSGWCDRSRLHPRILLGSCQDSDLCGRIMWKAGT